MAYKRKRSCASKHRRRTTKRRRRRKGTLKNIVPDKHVVRLRYVQQISLDAATGGVNTWVFRANSCFDPDFTGTGHQPLGFDQWSEFYDHYNVIGSKCTAQFIATGVNSATDGSMVGILLKDSSPAITSSPSAIMEQTGSGYSILTGQNATGTKTIRKGYSARRFFGLKDVADNRNLVGASVLANPVEDAFFHVYHTALNAGGNPRPVDVVVTIEFLCQFTERHTLAQS